MIHSVWSNINLNTHGKTKWGAILKISSLTLRNFRGYQDVTVEFDENFNVIIGKNDIGKSTILDALGIFFDNDATKADIDDYNVYSDSQEMSIQVSFIPQDKDYTIDTVPTNLGDEYLLDKQGKLTIKNVWDCSKGKLTSTCLKRYIIANYPSNFDTPLVSLKISDLKKLLNKYQETIDVDKVKKNKSSAIRQAIYEVENTDSFDTFEIPVDKEDGKKIWESLKQDLPLFFIFRSDRQNKDTDKEVQDPLKAITKTAISELETDLNIVKERIFKTAEKLGEKTIEKLKEMNPEIAKVLSPNMEHKPWESLFSFSFSADDGIRMNKRGSGVRRLILLNYFRAEAERKNSAMRNVIYAIEEPETSQHPDWQVELLNALIELSENDNTQVLITTHSPSLASLVNPSNILYVFKDEKQIKTEKGSTENFLKIAESLGVLPNISVAGDSGEIKVILCVEGPKDVDFFYHIGKLFNLDLKNDGRILVLSLGGGTLIHWVNNNYLGKLNKSEIHIYDSDVQKYQKAVDIVNSRDNCWASLTNQKSIENYIHPSLIRQVYPITDDFHSLIGSWQTEWATLDVPRSLSSFLKQLKENGNRSIKNEGKESIKGILASKAAEYMNIDLLKDLLVYEEVEGWFNKIKSNLLD